MRIASEKDHRPRRGGSRRKRGLAVEVASEMDTEDGMIWIRGRGEDAVMAFTDFGIENLIELIKINKDDPTLLER